MTTHSQKSQESMGKFRHLMGTELGLRNEGFRALWVVNFPMLEWDEDEERFCLANRSGDIDKMVSLDHKDQKLLEVRANAYDMVINGVEVGGGSVRIHDRSLQEKVFEVLGFSKEEALAQFGFLMGAFEYGAGLGDHHRGDLWKRAPPHAGLAFGLDRLCTIIGGKTTIRDFIAFPKNNMGRDTMINTPAAITGAQLAELSIETTVDEERGEFDISLGSGEVTPTNDGELTIKDMVKSCVNYHWVRVHLNGRRKQDIPRKAPTISKCFTTPATPARTDSGPLRAGPRRSREPPRREKVVVNLEVSPAVNGYPRIESEMLERWEAQPNHSGNVRLKISKQ
eukprot:s129_g6.t1